MWPFNKKGVDKTNLNGIQNEPILTPYAINLRTFGSGSVDWVHVVDKKQNDLLLIDYFNQLSEVSAPIRKYSDPVKIVKLELFNKEGKRLEDHPLQPILKDFWENSSELLLIYDLLLGNAYIEGLSHSTTDDIKGTKLKELVLFPSEYTLIDLKESDNIDFRNVEIRKYEVDITASKYKKVTALPENVLHYKNQNPFKDSANNVYGISRLASAEKNLQAIVSGYGARISLYDNGPKVVLTGKGKEDAFSGVNESEETTEIQKKLNDTYGRAGGQFQMMVTKAALDVTNISLNVKDLQLNELNGADFRRICNALNQDSKIHGDPDSTTYDNVNTALTDFYVNAFRPKIEKMLQQLTSFINTKGYPEVTIKGNYSSIKEIAQFDKRNDLELFRNVETGLMTRNEYLEQIGQQKVSFPEFDSYMTFFNGQWLPLTIQNNGQENDN